MFRYFAAAWNAFDRRDADAAQVVIRALRAKTSEWQSVFSERGLTVYCAGVRPGASEPYHLPENAGVVLGTIFRRANDGETPSHKATFGRAETHRLIATHGRELIAEYWGRYVAFLCDREGGDRWIVRSPTGELECLTASFQGVSLYFSSMHDCAALELLSFSPNWDYVAADLSTFMFETRDTGLNEVSRLLHGECVDTRQGKTSRSYYWHPFQIVRSAAIEDPADAAAALQTTAKACVRAWASCHTSILQLLSGGLDSSIVLGCVKGAPNHPKVTCLNYRNPYDLTTDERTYARLAAQSAGCTLIEHESNAHFTIERMMDLPRRASPFNSTFELGHAELEARTAHSCGATAYFTGMGGDQLFYQNGAQHVVADYFHQHGIRPAALGIAMAAARMEGGWMWPFLFNGLVDGVVRDPMTSVFARFVFGPLVPPEVVESVRKKRLFLHPWFDCTDRIPPGKVWQIMGLSMDNELHSPCAQPGDPENVFPLTSQPLVELCLRIPTYVLAADGLDRALARRAFRGDVPQEILRRRAKGVVSDYAKAVVTTNIEFIRELLLDGMLIKERLLDRQKLEQALSGESRLGRGAQILKCVTSEAWLSTWAGTRRRAAA